VTLRKLRPYLIGAACALLAWKVLIPLAETLWVLVEFRQ